MALPRIYVSSYVVEEVVDKDGLVQAVLDDVIPQLGIVML
jgi:hypothetical protein